MVDIFISYSRSDRPAAELIAKALAQEGFTVWWDHQIPPGTDFHTVIEQEIEAAKCVLVLWSNNSVASKWVRAEAAEGNDRDILLPVLIQHTKIPFPFRLIQTEDFTTWGGQRNHEAWQRLRVQLGAMTGREVESDISFPSTSPIRTYLSSRNSGGGPKPYGNIFVIALLVLAWLTWLFAPNTYSNPLTIALGLSAIILFLFRAAERDISPRMRSLAARWLLPRKDGPKVSTAEAFNQLFEAVFGKEHFSAFCFVRSTIASVCFLALLLVLARSFLGATVVFDAGVWFTLIFFGGVVNVLGDYASLYETRILLREFGRGMNIVVLVIVDLVATIIIFLTSILLAIAFIYALSVLSGHTGILQGLGYGQAVLRDFTLVLKQPYLDLYEPNSSELFPVGHRRLLYSAAITTFLTSIWLWAALIFTPIVRILIWASGSGLTMLGIIFDVQRAPFAALGYLSSLITLIIGALVWGAGEVLAALTK